MPTNPRYIEPKSVYFITRCIEGRRFLLRPDRPLSSVFQYMLAHYAKRHGVDVHLVVVMSTHFHMVVSVEGGNVSDFMHDLDLLLSKELKRLRPEAIGVSWEPGKLSVVQLLDREALIEELAYSMANPVEAGLVWEPHLWPGVTATVDELGVKVLEGERPPGRSPKRWPAKASIPLTWPEWLADDVEDAKARVQARLDVLVEQAHAKIRRAGWKVMSARQAQRVSPYRVARTRHAPGLRPHLAAGSKAVRREGIARLKAFRARHRECKQRWCAGERDVVFPAGTYWMKKHHGVRTEPFP